MGLWNMGILCGFPLTLSPYFTILPAGGHSENEMALGTPYSSLVSLC
jgi:hypothetical protein